MAKYIEREALLKWVREFYPNDKVFASAIINAPPADVAPVRNGHWNTGYFHDRVCSCCCHPDNDINDYAHSYCPNCGAKMDGGGGDAAD